MLTPERLYDKDKTREVLAEWGSAAVSQSLRALLDRKLLTRRSSDRDRITPGRNYRTSEKYLHFVCEGNLNADGH